MLLTEASEKFSRPANGYMHYMMFALAPPQKRKDTPVVTLCRFGYRYCMVASNRNHEYMTETIYNGGPK